MPSSKECTRRLIENSKATGLAAVRIMREKQGLPPIKSSNKDSHAEYLKEWEKNHEDN